MGGNPGVLGNGLGAGIQFPRTEWVPDIKGFYKKLRRGMLFRSNIEESLATMFRDDYSDPDDLKRVVAKSVERMKAGYFPAKLVEQQSHDEEYNLVAACK